MTTHAFALLALLLLAPVMLGSVSAADSTESDFYTIETFTPPEVAFPEVGGLQLLPNGDLAVATRRGEIWMVRQPLGEVDKAEWRRFAHGLHEVLGLAYRDGWLYATQRGEVSRLKDTNGDGAADVFETVNDGWHIDGDYHEYAFGSKFDRNGDLWVVLCLTGSFSSNSKYRGWCVRITPHGEMIPTCSGIRSPGGIGANAKGDMFYTDNQGPWNGTCALKHLPPGKFVGHPGGNHWYELATASMGPRPQDPNSGSRFMIEADRIPEYEPPAVLFPYQSMGQSASGVACDESKGQFGPFREQMFVGDVTHSIVMRVFLEQVEGHYQGACFPFRNGFRSGCLALEMMPNGTLMVGGTDRGWGSRGGKPYALERLTWTGKTPFEILEMKAQLDGFVLNLTEPAMRDSATNLDSYAMTTYTYIYQEGYGSPEVDHTTPKITAATLSDDGRQIRLTVDGLQRGHVHDLKLPGLKNAAGHGLLHPRAFYTLNYIPK